MAHTTIKVEDTVRDRLALLAAEKGTTIAGLVSDFAAHTPTESERAERVARTLSVLRDFAGYTPTPEQDLQADAELARRLDGAA
ncbi:hypothetical protein [Streptomyces sp. Wb2n-11]|uniref:hypothetical protein n=1 Tax=Streptomyces sp. Wb2n-11 TaxID=1030533 RepID=UPI000B089855|nr:hypothetical protein [Streptomyces sp. Wb2n-11]